MKNKITTINFQAQDLIIDLKKTENVPQAKSQKSKKILTILFIILLLLSTSLLAKAEFNNNDLRKKTEPISSNEKNNDTSVKMTATVKGWFEAKQTTNERLDISTNMEVYINGKRALIEKSASKTASLSNDLNF